MSATANAELARALLANGRPDEALAQLGQLANVDPPPLRVFTLKAQCYAQKKRWSDALAELQRVGSAGGLPRGLTGYFLGRAGRRTEAAQLLDELLKRQRASGGMELDLALTYAGLGDRSQILTWITRGADARSFFPLDETTPTLFRILESFRGDSAFDRLMLRLGHQYR
jgi:tetratricopeptide (TPR) repeat protein